MPTVHVEAQLTPEELLKAVGQLSPPELDDFTARVLALRAERFAPRLSVEETVLLQRINEAVPLELRRRYRELIARRDNGILTSEEQAELLRLTDAVENREAERVAHLAELARLRGVTLRALVEQLGLPPLR
jgi:hypothetical protein